MSTDGFDSADAQFLLKALPTGHLLGERYRIEQALGAGGGGGVFAAHDVRADVAIAIKVLHPSLAARPQIVRRFRREADVALRVRHPSLIEVLDFGESAGLHYMVLERLEGEDLDTALLRTAGQGRDQLAIDVLVAALSALWIVHEAGIVHRDFKPSNLFLWRRGDASGIKLLDFGIAQDFEDDQHLTQTGEVLGTPLYMSPEQALGELADGRADLYAAACVGFELLCGKPPFDKGSPYLTMLAHMEDPPPRPRDVRPALPASMEAFLLRGLEKDRSVRFVSAEEMLEALCLAAPELGVRCPAFATLADSVRTAVRGLPETPDEAVEDGTVVDFAHRARGAAAPKRDTVPAPSAPAPAPVAGLAPAAQALAPAARATPVPVPGRRVRVVATLAAVVVSAAIVAAVALR